jgi:AI-2 transport protein TqsA
MTDTPAGADPRRAPEVRPGADGLATDDGDFLDLPAGSFVGQGDVLPPPEHVAFVLPRGLIIVLGLAAGVIVAGGLRAVPNIVGPIFLALVLVITVDPLRSWLIRKGSPRWLATLALVLGIYAILIGMVVAAVVGAAQFSSILPQYSEQISEQLAGLTNWLAGMGVNKESVQAALSNVDSSKIVSAVTGLLSIAGSLLTSLLFVITLLIFLAVDSSVFRDRMVRVRAGREPVLTALGKFAAGTRKYFGVATIFGGIVAVLDWVALVIMGIPAAGLWALLAFVTNYIPNVGFLIGLIPPAFLGLLIGGWQLAVTVIAVYCVLNFIIQSVLQPKFVGDAVGLTTTMSFLSLIVWAFILGPIGAVLAIPASLLVKAVLVDMDPDARWLQLFFGDEPVFKVKDPNRPRRFRRKPQPAAQRAALPAADPPSARAT